jgi:hypothetical protein
MPQKVPQVSLFFQGQIGGFEAAKRIKGFSEVCRSLTEKCAVAEAERCLRYDLERK